MNLSISCLIYLATQACSNKKFAPYTSDVVASSSDGQPPLWLQYGFVSEVKWMRDTRGSDNLDDALN